MSAVKDGGPAFPSSHDVRIGEYATGGNSGISLRDYIAIKAMQSIIVNLADWQGERRWVSRLAYQQADAMLEERDA